jgi:hypothetical protein
VKKSPALLIETPPRQKPGPVSACSIRVALVKAIAVRGRAPSTF